MARKPVRGKNKDNARRAKKKISILSQERVDYVDYKDVNLLRRFMSDRAKIRANRVTQQRGARDRGDRGERQGLRADGPPPRPTAPPPGPGSAEPDDDLDAEL